MKYLKLFEEENIEQSRIGDIIYCIDASLSNKYLHEDTPYTIEDIDSYEDDTYFQLEELPDNINKDWWRCDRFVTNLEYHTNKYNL